MGHNGAMRLATLLGPDLTVALRSDPEALHDALEEFHPEDIAEIVEDLEPGVRLELLRALPDDFGADVLERLPERMQAEVLERMSTEEAAELLTEMDPDDRADVVQDLAEEVAEDLIAHLEEHEPEIAEEVRELAAYPEDVAGGLMTVDYVGLPPETKVWQAIEEVRRLGRDGEIETIHYIYVVFNQTLVGVVSLRGLILGDPGTTLADIMAENIVSVNVTDDQEEVARTIARYDFSAIPVLDDHAKMVGVVTVDDVVDVVIEEATEDAHMMGAVSPMEEGYFETDVVRLFRSRVMWLSLLFVGGFLTATVLDAYEAQLSAVITLAVFLPLIISSGGNSGSQSASLIIRALAVGDVVPGDWFRVLSRELVVSVALGLVLGLLGFGYAFFAVDTIDEPLRMGLAVSLSTIGVVLVGSLVGSLLPLGIQRIGLDPAVSSTPFIASLVDVVGLLIYLSVAGAVLGIA